MKKNVIFRIAAIVLMCTLVTACFASSTFAKYTSAVNGTGSLTVAKWDIEFKHGSTVVSDNFTINLADTIYDYGEGNDQTGTTAEADVVATKIAPGTSGSFSFTVNNKSETAADVSIKLKDNGSSTGVLDQLVFSLNSDFSNPITLTNAYQELDAGKIAVGGDAKTVTVYWNWTFDADDNDNALGDGDHQLKVAAQLVADQHN